ncbi:MAG: hypothetical protein QE279_02875 [Rhodoferax sp.]|nr:hypothetical protein [Rhodoferax sp.]
MKRAWLSFAGVLLLSVHAALGAQNEEVSAESQRSALSAERERQTRVFDTAERACYARFFTSDCLADVARSRRAMLADIKRKEAALDAAGRQQRAQDELQQLKQKQLDREAQLNALDPAAIDRAQREKQQEREDKLRDHASKPASKPAAAASDAARVPPAMAANPVKASKPPSGPSDQERAANQAVYDKKQAEVQRRVAERDQARAKAAANAGSAASAPRSLPLPAPKPPQ